MSTNQTTSHISLKKQPPPKQTFIYLLKYEKNYELKRIIRNRANKVWFARWTKSPWAVFRSLGAVVHIQSMSIVSFKDTLLHQPGASKVAAIRLFLEDELLGLLLDQDLPAEEELLVEDLLLAQIQTNNSEVAPCSGVDFSILMSPYQLNILKQVRTFFIPKIG